MQRVYTQSTVAITIAHRQIQTLEGLRAVSVRVVGSQALADAMASFMGGGIGSVLRQAQVEAQAAQAVQEATQAAALAQAQTQAQVETFGGGAVGIGTWTGDACMQQKEGGIAGAGAVVDQAMSFPSGVFTPITPWAFAVLPVKGKKAASWQESLTLFLPPCMHTIEKIAVSRKMQSVTIMKHLMTALSCGLGFDLSRLAAQCESLPTSPLSSTHQNHDALYLQQNPSLRQHPLLPPSLQEWQQLEQAAVRAGVDVVYSPAKFDVKDVLLCVGGECAEAVSTSFDTLTEAQQAVKQMWFSKVTWWVALKQAKYPVQFAPPNRKYRYPQVS
jgi:hypothetical protein